MSIWLLLLCANAAALVEEVDYHSPLDSNMHNELEDRHKLNSIELDFEPRDDRVKRFDDNQTSNTIMPNEVQEIKSILKNLLSSQEFDPDDPELENAIINNVFTNLSTTKETDAPELSTTSQSLRTLQSSQTLQTVRTLETMEEEYEEKYWNESLRIPNKLRSKPQLDMDALMGVLRNITRNNDLVSILNETLQENYDMITCNPNVTSQHIEHRKPSPVHKFDYYDETEINGTGEHISSCYVCGLEADGIPKQSVCGDAFAGDFLPLVPLDASARGYLARFRKYCKVMQVPNFYMPKEDRRSMWGRWTGGCSVRWTDLSNVYTQRTCRNKNRAVTGRHIASKRMAKLEMALKYTDNGCIVSPVASLLPLSRGISLYARFYTCVCTGDFCNLTTVLKPSVNILIFVVISLLSM